MLYGDVMPRTMHRTVLQLEEWLYGKLKAHAKRSGESIAAIVRGILSEHYLARAKAASWKEGLGSVKGIGRSGRASGDVDEIYDEDNP